MPFAGEREHLLGEVDPLPAAPAVVRVRRVSLRGRDLRGDGRGL